MHRLLNLCAIRDCDRILGSVDKRGSTFSAQLLNGTLEVLVFFYQNIRQECHPREKTQIGFLGNVLDRCWTSEIDSYSDDHAQDDYIIN